ncbi:MAG: sulfite exporter TauE/SafE family protein [Alphaproteobacteria bacterium]
MEALFQDLWSTATPQLWIIAAISILLAGILRAFTGFGFALIAVPVLGLIFAPQIAVPIVVGLEIVSGFALLPKARIDTDWGLFRILSLAALPTLPIGIWLLQILDDDTMRLLLSGILLLSVALFGIGAKAKGSGQPPGPTPTAATGLASGLMAGVSGIPGPPIVAYLMGTGLPPERQRATLIAYFIVVDAGAFLGFALTGNVTATTALAVALMVPAMLIGNKLGALAFRHFGTAAWQPVAGGLLFIIAAGLVARALF